MKLIENYNVGAIHTFQVRTLGSLGFKTRVTLSNNSFTNEKYSTDYSIDVSIYNSRGKRIKENRNITELKQRQKKVLDCEEFLPNEPGDFVLVFHFIPERFANRPEQGVSVSREELWYLFTAQDHYVEYFRESDGFSSGVLYQSGALNYQKFSNEFTTIVQAPKCYFSNEITTYISVFHTSPEAEYSHYAALKCSLVDNNGNVAASWIENIPPFRAHLIDLGNILEKKLRRSFFENEFFCFYAVCTTANLLPLTMNYNKSNGLLAVEHSLPPVYYGSDMRGAVRANAINNFEKSSLFAEATI